MGRKIPIRTCIGCRGKKSKPSLIRFVLIENGNVTLDPVGKAHGRGVYLCGTNQNMPDSVCLEKAIKGRSFSRAFKGKIEPESIEKIKIRYGKKTPSTNCYPHGPC